MTNVEERENEQILWMFQIVVVVGRVEWFRTIDVDSPFPSSVLYGYVGVVHLDDVKWSIEPCREFVGAIFAYEDFISSLVCPTRGSLSQVVVMSLLLLGSCSVAGRFRPNVLK